MIPVSGQMVREGLLDPALNALGFNGAQHRLMINLDAEVNSLVEWIASLKKYGVPGDELRVGIRYCQQVIELNHGEAESTRVVTETADRLARDAENATRNGGTKVGPGIKQLAARLRPALRTIALGADADTSEFLAAGWTLKDVFAEVATDRLLSRGMRGELGAGPFDLLSRLHAQAKGSETR